MTIQITKEMRNRAADKFASKPAASLFPNAPNLIRQGFCPLCFRKVESFKNDLSLKEYNISGMCQACQDTAFRGGK